MWASTLCPFSSSTRNMALGRGSTTVPSTSIASSLATLQLILCVGTRPEGARNAPREGRKRVYGQVRRCVHALRALDDRLHGVQTGWFMVGGRLDQDGSGRHSRRAHLHGHLEYDRGGRGQADLVRAGD